MAKSPVRGALVYSEACGTGSGIYPALSPSASVVARSSLYGGGRARERPEPHGAAPDAAPRHPRVPRAGYRRVQHGFAKDDASVFLNVLVPPPDLLYKPTHESFLF